jgi:peroxiredoxin Q/BCP
MAKAQKKSSKTSTKKTIRKVTKLVKKTKKATVKVAKPAMAKAKPKAAKTAKSVKKAKLSSKEYGLKIGDAVPKFSLPANNGKTISNADLGQGKTVLYFYPKDNTPGCTLEGQDFTRLLKEFAKAGAQVIGVSQDSVKSHEGFRAKCSFGFDLIADENGSLCKAFDVIQMKNMYGREFEGIERSTFVLHAGKIANEWRKVRVEGHAQAVLEFVRRL